MVPALRLMAIEPVHVPSLIDVLTESTENFFWETSLQIFFAPNSSNETLIAHVYSDDLGIDSYVSERMTSHCSHWHIISCSTNARHYLLTLLIDRIFISQQLHAGVYDYINKMLSYRRETALQGAL